VYSQAAGRTVSALFGGALIVFAFAVAAGFALSQTSGHKVFSRVWFFMFAFVSGVIACGLPEGVRVLEAIASVQHGV
jgi:hypothetical protein